ncbi:hypothetical protein HAX54_004192 [Datura stramonium]|uniref:Uncharacterized protein n=1 Tax=Datura stramonium TaxID=4076 RepID=A0ABS8T6L4_DATST|nr:hypothetical protein [Datura stramonium]
MWDLVFTQIRNVTPHWRPSERLISSGTTSKDASLTNIDLGFKLPGLKWKGKDAITRNQLQQMLRRKKLQLRVKAKNPP